MAQNGQPVFTHGAGGGGISGRLSPSLAWILYAFLIFIHEVTRTHFIISIQKEAAEAREGAEAVAVNGRVPVENGDVEGAAAPEVAKFGWIVGVLVRKL